MCYHADVLVVVGRDRGAVAHVEHGRDRRDCSCEQQRQDRGTVGRIARRKIVTRDASIGVQPAFDVHQLRRALWLPGVLLFSRQLDPNRAANGA